VTDDFADVAGELRSQEFGQSQHVRTVALASAGNRRHLSSHRSRPIQVSIRIGGLHYLGGGFGVARAVTVQLFGPSASRKRPSQQVELGQTIY
jgi:hypothetical protein